MSAEDYNKRELESGRLTVGHVTAAIRLAQSSLGLDTDGKAGPATRSALLPARRTEHPARAARAVDRAMSAFRWQKDMRHAGGVVRYGLGRGGKHPDAAHPFEQAANGSWRLDCSGFVAWCYNISRLNDGVWFYTDQIEADARGQVQGDLGFGVEWADRAAGDVLVYGAGDRVGHMGLVIQAGQAIHCAAGKHNGIVATTDEVFSQLGAVVFRFR